MFTNRKINGRFCLQTGKLTEDSVYKQEKLLLLRLYKNKTNNYEKKN